MKLSEKGQALLRKFKLFQKLDILLYAFAAISLVFMDSIPLMLIFGVMAIVGELKVYNCPHCKKGLDCRRRIREDSVCPKCGEQIFKI